MLLSRNIIKSVLNVLSKGMIHLQDKRYFHRVNKKIAMPKVLGQWKYQTHWWRLLVSRPCWKTKALARLRSWHFKLKAPMYMHHNCMDSFTTLMKHVKKWRYLRNCFNGTARRKQPKNRLRLDSVKAPE